MLRIQTTRESASTLINGVRFAQHPNPPQGGKLLVSHPVEPVDEQAAALLTFAGFEQAPSYDPADLRAIDDAIRAEATFAQSAAVAARDETLEGLQAANRNLSNELVEKGRTIAELKKQVGETATQDLRDEITRLQDRVRDAEAKPATLETENAQLRATNAQLGTDLAARLAERDQLTTALATITAEKEQLTKDLAAATKKSK